MKIESLCLVLALSLMLFCSCERTPQFIPELSVTCRGVSLEAGAGTEVQSSFKGELFTIKVSANCEWTADSNSDWIELNPVEGLSGESPLKITVAENSQFEVRAGEVKVSLKKYREQFCTISIRQGSDVACITVNPATLEFDEAAGEKTVEIDANCEWTAEASEAWISLNPARGAKGDRSLKISVAANSTSEIRTATILVGNPEYEISQRISISQKPDLSDYYVDEYNVNRGKGIVIGSTTWAPVNCGYSETLGDKPGNPYGKFYQWGRPVGFGYNTDDVEEDGLAVNVDGPVESVDAAIDENFYKNSNNWLSVNVNDLWNSGSETSPVKTKYDPCPTGWRVPTAAEIKELATNGQRWLTSAGDEWTEGSGLKHWGFSGAVAWEAASSKIYLPLGGWIATGSNAKDRGTGAFYWSSGCTSDNMACGLQVWANWYNKDFASGEKARGCNVRCVKEQ